LEKKTGMESDPAKFKKKEMESLDRLAEEVRLTMCPNDVREDIVKGMFDTTGILSEMITQLGKSSGKEEEEEEEDDDEEDEEEPVKKAKTKPKPKTNGKSKNYSPPNKILSAMSDDEEQPLPVAKVKKTVLPANKPLPVKKVVIFPESKPAKESIVPAKDPLLQVPAKDPLLPSDAKRQKTDDMDMVKVKKLIRKKDKTGKIVEERYEFVHVPRSSLKAKESTKMPQPIQGNVAPVKDSLLPEIDSKKEADKPVVKSKPPAKKPRVESESSSIKKDVSIDEPAFESNLASVKENVASITSLVPAKDSIVSVQSKFKPEEKKLKPWTPEEKKTLIQDIYKIFMIQNVIETMDPQWKTRVDATLRSPKSSESFKKMLLQKKTWSERIEEDIWMVGDCLGKYLSSVQDKEPTMNRLANFIVEISKKDVLGFDSSMLLNEQRTCFFKQTPCR